MSFMIFSKLFRKTHSGQTVASVRRAFPASLHADVLAIMEMLGVAQHEPYSDDSYHATVEGDQIIIPYRAYFPECHASDFKQATPQQMAVISAIMTRHKSGYQREIWAAQVCRYPACWAVPFVAYLLEDYVVEVLSALETNLSPEWEKLFVGFPPQGQTTRRQLNHRIINYWNYYRGRQNYYCLTNYPGYTIAKRLGLWDPRTAPRLTKKRNTSAPR